MERKGKYFWTHLDGTGDQVLFHFGMTGSLIVRHHGHPYTELKERDWPPRFVKLELTMDDGTQVAFTDARRCSPECIEQSVVMCPDNYACLCSSEARYIM